MQEKINYPSPDYLGLIMPFRKIFEICRALKTEKNKDIFFLEENYVKSPQKRNFGENCEEEWKSIEEN